MGNNYKYSEFWFVWFWSDGVQVSVLWKNIYQQDTIFGSGANFINKDNKKNYMYKYAI
jgi:hypothetical protein